MVEKILEISRPIKISDICIQLGQTQICQLAEQLLEKYKSKMRDSTDSIHPQYAAMAIYQACLQQKVKIIKKKIIDFSNLKSAQWESLAIQWTKSMDEIKLNAKIVTEKIENSVDSSNVEKKIDLNETVLKNQPKEQVIEDFEVFKKRILMKSYEHLKKNNQLGIVDIHSRCLELFDDDIENIRDRAYEKYLLYKNGIINESGRKECIDISIYAACIDEGIAIPQGLARVKDKEYLKAQFDKLVENEEEVTTEQVINFDTWVKNLKHSFAN